MESMGKPVETFVWDGVVGMPWMAVAAEVLPNASL